MIYHLDFETASECDLRKCGAYRYAEDRSTRILLVGVARAGEEPHIFIPDKNGGCGDKALEILRELSDPEAVIYAHNAQFERALTHYQWWRWVPVDAPALDQWRCTSVLARKAGLSPHLGTLSIQLGLTAKKDSGGASLIQKFSLPPFADPELHPVEWQDFIEYCLQDVRAEMEVHRRLSVIDLKPFELAAYQLDTRVNHRGFPVNRLTLERADEMLHDFEQDARKKFESLTGLAITQRGQFLSWLKEHGYPYGDLQSATREKAAEDISWAKGYAAPAFHLYHGSTFAALQKIRSMLRWVCKDGYVRGVHYFFGATTGRWASKGVQVQNAKRATDRGAQLYHRLEAGLRGEKDTPEALSEAVRHFIQPHDGTFLDVDFSNIEARILAWLAGQEDILSAFREGEDVYKLMAADIYRKAPEEVTKDERFVGKTAILGLGYGMGAAKFKDTCTRFGHPIDDEFAEEVVRLYRGINTEVKSMWSDMDSAARKAVIRPGSVQYSGMIRFLAAAINGIPYLIMKLPSTRVIMYPQVKVAGRDMSYFSQEHYEGRQYKRGDGWDGRRKLYGGLLVENAVQGVAFDLMAGGAIEAERQGYKICALIHDQCLAYGGEEDLPGLISAMTTLPDWARGLPLEADGKVTRYYTK